MKPIQYLGPLFKQCRLDKGPTLMQVCVILLDQDVYLGPGQLQDIENEAAIGSYEVMNALWEVTGATLGQIERRIAEVEARFGQ